jgi:hypothetical protein
MRSDLVRRSSPDVLPSAVWTLRYPPDGMAIADGTRIHSVKINKMLCTQELTADTACRCPEASAFFLLFLRAFFLLSILFLLLPHTKELENFDSNDSTLVPLYCTENTHQPLLTML